MNIIKQHFTRWHLAASLLVVPLLAQSLLPSLVDAGTFTKTQVRFDRMKISTATTGTVCFAPHSNYSNKLREGNIPYRIFIGCRRGLQLAREHH